MTNIVLPGAPAFSKYLQKTCGQDGFILNEPRSVVKDYKKEGFEFEVLLRTLPDFKKLGNYFVCGRGQLPCKSYEYLRYDGIIPGYINAALARREKGESDERFKRRMQDDQIAAVILHWGYWQGEYRRIDFNHSIPFP
jgi:hypothetical protein